MVLSTTLRLRSLRRESGQARSHRGTVLRPSFLSSTNRSEQIASLQALAKIRDGKDEDAVLGAATLRFQAYNDALLDPWIILYESAEGLGSDRLNIYFKLSYYSKC